MGRSRSLATPARRSRGAPGPRRRAAAATAVLVLGLAAASPDPAAAAPPDPAAAPADGVVEPGAGDVESGLRALHRGEYRLALEAFKRAAERAPGAPGPLFYPVFARWWQGLFADGDADRPDAAFDAAYAEAHEAAKARLAEAPRDVDALATLGGSQILRAHVEATRGNYWRSGQEARRGKKALEQAIAIDPDREAALFGLGALNYYADRVPLIVKGMRVLFFMPGGDTPLGLRQIRRVAEAGGPLRVDGRLLLGTVCADRYQQAYDDGLAHLERALAENGGSPLIRAAIGDLQIRLARHAAAAATLRRGIAESATGGIEAARQRRWLGLGLAEALAGDWRLDEADQALHRAVAEEAPVTDALARTERRVRAEIAARRAAVPGWRGRPAPAAAPAGGGDAAAGAAARLLIGHLLLEEGRAAEAVPVLEAAHGLLPRDPPPWLAGGIHLALGIALKGPGDTAGARAHLDRAASTRRFRAADRARLELGERGKDAALCAP